MSFVSLKSILGRRVYLTPHNQLAAQNGFVAGGNGRPGIVYPSPDTIAVFDDFLGDSIDAKWGYAEGDTGNSGALTGSINGVYRLQISNTPATASPSAGAGFYAGSRNWRGNMGPDSTTGRLRMGARVQLTEFDDTGTRMSVFVGFTDNVSYEVPIYDTGAGVVSQASNAVGFIAGARADTGWTAVAVDNDTDRTPVHLTTDLASGTYQTLEIEIHRGDSDTGGTAVFFVDGVAKGEIKNPLNMSTLVTPVIYAFPEDTGGGMRVEMDWLNISGPRA